MQAFLQHHAQHVTGTLSGFDRIRFRGTLRLLAHIGGMRSFLWQQKVLLKNFMEYAKDLTRQICLASELLAGGVGGVRYLRSSARSKEDEARRIQHERGVKAGLICVFSAVEPCRTFKVRGDRASKELVLEKQFAKCLHYYFYVQHAQIGFLHVRVQTWFPFNVHVCLNGREWLAQELEREKIPYLRQDNRYLKIGDPQRAQELFDRQLHTDWARLLGGLVQKFHPAYPALLGSVAVPYYWSANESEWATDVMFDTRASLVANYAAWLNYGLHAFNSREVMRFLGRRLPAHAGVAKRFEGQVLTDLRGRTEGLRIKHWLNHNSIKMYDQCNVLRVETTINDPHDMKVYRPKEGGPEDDKQWRYLRKGTAAIYRLSELAQKANERYLNALACVKQPQPLAELTQSICQRKAWKKTRVRALNPLAETDAALLAAVNRGEFVLNGFRNRDLCALLFASPSADPKEKRRRSAAVTRKIRMLRAHGLIRKISTTHRYMVTETGRQIISAVLLARTADMGKLSAAA